jgi:hypothetical protein
MRRHNVLQAMLRVAQAKGHMAMLAAVWVRHAPLCENSLPYRHAVTADALRRLRCDAPDGTD